jgi:NADPH-dependent curcumin reductase CurA
MSAANRQVVLASRPSGYPVESNFRVEMSAVPEVGAGEFLLRNAYVSLDAGFRNWMNEGSGDEVLPAMAVGAPVMGLTLGQVVKSRNDDYPEGEWLMARLAWEEYSLSNGGDFISRLPEPRTCPLAHYLGVLGDTGLSAYFGLLDIGKPQPGETVLVSAAGGAVGNVVGQIAAIHGARVVGLAGTDEKCQRLVDELGFDAAVNHRSADLPAEILAACPGGVDVYFDSVGGTLLETVLDQIAEGARIVMCGAVSAYNATGPLPGPDNLFQLVTRQALMQGYMTHFAEHRYPQARAVMTDWLNDGRLKNIEYRLQGIEQVGRAFCDLFDGNNFGKTIVQLYDDQSHGK